MISILKMSDSLLKSIKSRRKDSFKDQFPIYVQKPKHPLPFVRKSFPNDDKMRKKLRIRGDKYFSKVAISGPETVTTLKKLQGSQVKYIKNFEFDPYLCDFSGLKPLAKVFRRTKMSHSLNLVIRRVDIKRENSCFLPFISRLIQLKKLRIEFPSTPNFDDRDMINLTYAISKCHSLKCFEIYVMSLPDVTPKVFGAVLVSLKGMPKLEALSINILSKEISFDNDDNVKLPKIHSFPKLPKLKSFKLYVGRSSSQWVEFKKESDKGAQQFLKSFSKAMNPEKFAIKIHGHGQQDDEMRQALTETLSNMTNLRHLSYEYLNSNISDIDIQCMMQEMIECPQIESFSFKVIQHPNVSEELIYPFVSCLSKLKNIKKCDLYFRRLNVLPEDVKELVKQLQKIENVQCSAFKQSLYVWWDKSKIIKY